MNDDLFEVGIYAEYYNRILDIDLPILKIVQSKGLKIHIQKRHPNVIGYLPNIPDIITEPDYIGTNPKEPNSIELVKISQDTIKLAIKLDIDNDYYFVASLYDITKSKLDKHIESGRLKKYLTK